jgi:hypothetical protein
MQSFKIITQHGEVTVEIKVISDPVFDKLGLEATKIEQAMANIIGEKLFSMGAMDSRPARWDN